MKIYTITDELLRELHSEADLPLREKIEKEVPALIGLEVGKNYKLSNGSIFNFSGKFDEEGDPIGWGISYDSIFYKSSDFGWGIQDGYQPANDEEVKAALIGEAKKRGYTKDNFESLSPNSEDNFDGWCYWDACLYTANEGMGGKVVFKNGTWASIIEQPKPSLSEAIAEYEKAHEKFLKILKNE